MFKVIVHKRASLYLRKLSRPQKEAVKNELEKLKVEPPQNPRVRQMLGEWKGYHRIRIGNLRVIFWIDTMGKTIYVDHIGPRGDIY